MIACRQLSFAYSRQAPALENIDFLLPDGQTLGIVGGNGSGKSTLLSILAGLYSPTRGEAQIGAATSPGEEQTLRRQAGLVMQNADLQILGSTVAEDLLLGFESSGGEPREKARLLARRFALEKQWAQPVQTLSWGQKRKLCLCGILMHDPDVLLLDEPFSGLDYAAGLEMREILKVQRAADLTQVLAVHDLEPVADLVDLWAVLQDGQLKAFGKAEQIFDGLRKWGIRPPCSWQAGHGVQPWDWNGAPA